MEALICDTKCATDVVDIFFFLLCVCVSVWLLFLEMYLSQLHKNKSQFMIHYFCFTYMILDDRG